MNTPTRPSLAHDDSTVPPTLVPYADETILDLVVARAIVAPMNRT